MDKVMEMIRSIGLPFAYHHFAEGEAPVLPYLVYMVAGSNHFSADGRVYYKVLEFHLELYTKWKDPDMELRVEKTLDEEGIFYEKLESYIKEEGFYQVLYIFEMEE